MFIFQNGFVELREFRKIIQLLHHYDELSKLFEELDTNDDHRINFAEFKKGFSLLGEDNADEQFLRKEFNSVDTNRGGYILFDEVSSREQFSTSACFRFHCVYS